MTIIKNILSSIPEGKKRSYLGNTYIKGIQDFFIANDAEIEVDLDFVLEFSFYDILLNDLFLKDLQLFSNQTTLDLLGCSEKEITNLSLPVIREKLSKALNFEITSLSLKKDPPNNSTKCEYTLHPFQERMRRRVINLIFQNQKRFLIHMPTGAGKTRTAVEIIIDFIRLSSAKALLTENFKILWIAQSKELCEQAFESFNFLYNLKGTNNIKIGHFYGDYNINPEILVHPTIIFCSIQKLLSQYNKKTIWDDIRDDNYLVVVDEAHRSVAKEWKKALDFFVNNPSTYLLGLTATPGTGSIDDISSGYTVASYYDNNKLTLTNEFYQDIDKPIQYLIDQQFLAKIKRIEIPSNNILSPDIILQNNEGVFKFKNEPLALRELSINPARNHSIINIIQSNLQENPNCKILVFTCGVDHNKILQAILSLYEIRSAYIDAKTKSRSEIIDNFKDGKLNVLLNYGVLTTGFDAPKTNVCIIARPISSIVMYSQMVGRILRGPKNQGNKENKLYTIKDNFNHGDYDEMFNSFNEFYN